MLLLEAQAHHDEGGCFVLTNHPFISSRPSKAVALERLIEDVKAPHGMWVTALAAIAEHPAVAVPEAREMARIEIPAGYFDGTAAVAREYCTK